jgi:hypothetical protein
MASDTSSAQGDSLDLHSRRLDYHARHEEPSLDDLREVLSLHDELTQLRQAKKG